MVEYNPLLSHADMNTQTDMILEKEYNIRNEHTLVKPRNEPYKQSQAEPPMCETSEVEKIRKPAVTSLRKVAVYHIS